MRKTDAGLAVNKFDNKVNDVSGELDKKSINFQVINLIDRN